MTTIIGESFNGSTIKGDAVMLDKYGDVYNVIDNLYHPNPGTKEDGYSEIERCINWLVENEISSVDSFIEDWIYFSTVLRLKENPDYDFDELVSDIMYDDNYTVHPSIKNQIKAIYDRFNDGLDKLTATDEECEQGILDNAEQITDYINEKFLRVRAGGKLNPEGADAIYFRISSHGFDWYNIITDFLWDVFKRPSSMPRRIVVCYDLETRGSDKVLYDGNASGLIDEHSVRLVH